MTPSSRIPKKFLVVLKRTWDETLSSGLMLVIFVTTHLFQFYFADTVHSRIQVACTFGNALVGEFMVPFLLVFTVFRTAVNSDFVYSSTACFDGCAYVDDRESKFEDVPLLARQSSGKENSGSEVVSWFDVAHVPLRRYLSIIGNQVDGISLVALVSRSQWPIPLTPSGSSYRYTSSLWSVGYLRVVVLGGNFCHDVLYFSYLCRALPTPAHPVVLPTEKDAYILHTLRIPTLHVGLRVSGKCRCHWGASFFYWLPRLSCRRKLHRCHDRAKSRANPHHLLMPRVVDVLKPGDAASRTAAT